MNKASTIRLISLGLIVLTILYIFDPYINKILCHGTTTTAVVQKSVKNTAKSSRIRKKSYTIYYEYEVDGKTYTDTTDLHTSFPTGKTVNIYYDKNHLERTGTVSFLRSDILYIEKRRILKGIAFICIAVITLFKAKRMEELLP